MGRRDHRLHRSQHHHAPGQCRSHRRQYELHGHEHRRRQCDHGEQRRHADRWPAVRQLQPGSDPADRMDGAVGSHRRPDRRTGRQAPDNRRRHRHRHLDLQLRQSRWRMADRTEAGQLTSGGFVGVDGTCLGYRGYASKLLRGAGRGHPGQEPILSDCRLRHACGDRGGGRGHGYCRGGCVSLAPHGAGQFETVLASGSPSPRRVSSPAPAGRLPGASGPSDSPEVRWKDTTSVVAGSKQALWKRNQ